MTKCPNCNIEIERLNNFISGENRYSFGLCGERADYDFQADGKTNDFECPECSEVLFTDDGKAIDFLKNQDELQKVVIEKLNKIKELKNENKRFT